MYDWAAATTAQTAPLKQNGGYSEEFRTRHDVQERLFNKSLPTYFTIQPTQNGLSLTPESITHGSMQAIRHFREDWPVRTHGCRTLQL